MRLRVGAGTDTGHVRAMNEDVFMVRPEHGLFVVCDGMGGAPAGEVASQVAATAIVQELTGRGARRNGHNGASGASADLLPQTTRLAEAVRRSNQMIYAQAQQDPSQTGMGTTVVGAWVEAFIASVAHVGDSRAYLWRDRRLEPLTRDHSLVEEQVRAGLIDREQGRQSEHQNVLVRALGREPDVDVDVNEVLLQPGDYLLLCSDGLTRMVPETAMAEAIVQVRDPQRICEHLIGAANENGGTDNITVVVVEVTASRWRRLWDSLTGQPGRGHDADAHAAV